MGTRIKGSLGLTKKIKDFDFFRVDAGIERDIADGADEEEEWKKLWDDVEKEIEKRIHEEFE